jgi:hypothetical protein
VYRLQATLAFTFMMTFGLAIAGETGRPVGKNCDLSVPPDTAGEVSTGHAAILLIFPRARDITANYDGCQAVWVQTREGTNFGWLVWIKSGEPVRMWSPDKEVNAKYGGCFWQQGHLTKGSEAKCPPPSELIMKSLGPGCFSKTKDAVANQGLGAARPPECENDE